MKKRLFLTSITLLSLLPLTGCVFAMGDTTARPAPHDTPTIGQQLIDLKKAKDAGAISDQEYDAKKAQLLGK